MAKIPARAPTSTPTVGESRIRSFGFGRQPLGEDDALLVAAGQGRHRVARAADLDAELADPVVRPACASLRRTSSRQPSIRSSTAITVLSAIDCGWTSPSDSRSSDT